MRVHPLLHPVAVAAIALLMFNDHVAKVLWPSAVTGKLSDVAGLVFFPCLLHAAWVLAARPSRRAWRLGMAVCVAATVAVFSVIQLDPVSGQAYAFAVGALQWPVVAAVEALAGCALPPLRSVTHTADPTDLVTLPCALVGLVLLGTGCHPRPQPLTPDEPTARVQFEMAASPKTQRTVALQVRVPTSQLARRLGCRPDELVADDLQLFIVYQVRWQDGPSADQTSIVALLESGIPDSDEASELVLTSQEQSLQQFLASYEFVAGSCASGSCILRATVPWRWYHARGGHLQIEGRPWVQWSGERHATTRLQPPELTFQTHGGGER